MDIEKLIEQLKYYGTTYAIGDNLGKEIDGSDELMLNAATALSTLKGENEKLRAELENYRKGHCSEGGCAAEKDRDLVIAENEKLRDAAEGMRSNWYKSVEGIKKLRAELEQVKREKDAAVSWVQKYTESIDRPCVACKHNTGDYVCTAICGNCGPMGTESCKWEFDFSGEPKED